MGWFVCFIAVAVVGMSLTVGFIAGRTDLHRLIGDAYKKGLDAGVLIGKQFPASSHAKP